jgi:2-iminobutanoate/2-iminopropanoate deaminase
VRVGNLLFIAGQGPLDPQTGEIKGQTFAEQCRLTLQNIKNIVEGHGGDIRNLVKVNVYLTDMANFNEMNAIYTEFFGEYPPARTTVGAQLGGILIEVEAIAALDD